MAECEMTTDRILPPAYTLHQVVERLPVAVQQKYEGLKALLADAEALQRSLMDRMKATEERLARISRTPTAMRGSWPECSACRSG